MAKDRDNGFRLMGFGHRVYKNFDPRATVIKKACDRVLDKLGIVDPILDLVDTAMYPERTILMLLEPGAAEPVVRASRVQGVDSGRDHRRNRARNPGRPGRWTRARTPPRRSG